MIKRLLACLLLLLSGLAHAQFDHRHAAWNGLVGKHVRWLPDNTQSQVDYAGFQRDRGALKQVLDAMSAVPQAEFDNWMLFRLFGEPRHLDWIEHEQLRPLYKDPRIHAAVNCASIGCPALRNEAFAAVKLEAQLEDGMQRFLADRTRNRVRDGRLEVSAIFKWFQEDFERGEQGFAKVEDVFAKYAALLSDKPEEQARLRSRTLPVTHLDDDWSLNGVGR